MIDPIGELRDTHGIDAVEESEIPGVDYYVTAEGDYGVQHIRTIWLKRFRSGFGWVGQSEYHAETQFALLMEKDQ